MPELVFHEDNQDEIRDLLIGQRVEKLDDERVRLSNGTIIKAVGNEGGCACSAGDYDLSLLNGVDNAITSVDFDYSPAGDGDAGEGYYRIFVYADHERINLMQFDGDDGNGYYGTGFNLFVRKEA